MTHRDTNPAPKFKRGDLVQMAAKYNTVSRSVFPGVGVVLGVEDPSVADINIMVKFACADRPWYFASHELDVLSRL